MELFPPDKMDNVLDYIRTILDPSVMSTQFNGQYVSLSSKFLVCRICAIDIGTTDSEFFNPVKSNECYDIATYGEIVLNTSWRKMKNSISLHAESRPKADIEMIAKIIIKYLAQPLSGNYSWSSLYYSEIRKNSRYENFELFSAEKLDRRGAKIQEMLKWSADGWKAKADAYFSECWPENGYEFATKNPLISTLRC